MGTASIKGRKRWSTICTNSCAKFSCKVILQSIVLHICSLHWSGMSCPNPRILLHAMKRPSLENDSIEFTFPKTKLDQTVNNSNNVWHVYANPTESKKETCPIHALAIYHFSCLGILKGGRIFFECASQYGHIANLNTVAKCQTPIIFEESENIKFYCSFKQTDRTCKLLENHSFPNMVMSPAISNQFCEDKSKNLAPYMLSEETWTEK